MLFDKVETTGTTGEARPEDSENDVNPHLRVVDPPPNDRNVPQDLNVGEDRDRRRNDEARAPPNNEDEIPASPRITRRTARESGVPVPEFPNVQPTVLERSRRDQAAAREIMNQFRKQTTEALLNRQ